MMTANELKELEEVERKMTPETWEFDAEMELLFANLPNGRRAEVIWLKYVAQDRNMTGIAKLRNSFRPLLDHIKEQEREIKELKNGR